MSFSRIAASGSADCFTAPIDERRRRAVLVLQKRLSNDFPLKDFLAVLLVPQISAHWLMNAETKATDLPVVKSDKISVERDRQGVLRGTITMIPRHSQKDTRKRNLHLMESLGKLLRQARDCDNDGVRHLQRLASEDLAAVTGTITLNFALMRTGECRIWYDQAIDGLGEAERDAVAEQGYYFIKDIAHDHTHHDERDDQITPLVCSQSTIADEGHDGEVAWRRETMWSLSREIEQRNRDGGLVSQRQALGIIAYAEAFQASLMTHVRDRNDPLGFRMSDAIHDFDFTYLKDSVKASVDVLSTKLSQRIQILIAGVATFVSSSALYNSLIATRNASYVGQSEENAKTEVAGTEWLIDMFGASPLIFGSVITFVMCAVVALFLADGRAGLFNGAQRTLSQLGRAAVVTTELSPAFQLLLLVLYHLLIVALAAGATVLSFWLLVNGGQLCC